MMRRIGVNADEMGVGLRTEETMLGGRFALGDVSNVEALARRVLDDRLRSMSSYLNPTEREDALSFLVAEAWRLHGRYDPAKGTQTFSTYAYRILSKRVSSWYRQRFGDSRYRLPAIIVSFDDGDVDELDGLVAADGRNGELPTHRQAAIQVRFPELTVEQSAALTRRANELHDEARSVDSSLFEQVNLAALTPAGRRIFEQLARPMVEHDLTLEQLADRFGHNRRWVTQSLGRLREELEPMLEAV